MLLSVLGSFLPVVVQRKCPYGLSSCSSSCVSRSCVWVLPAEYEKLDRFGDDFSYVHNAWLDIEYMICISTDAFREFHIFSTSE